MKFGPALVLSTVAIVATAAGATAANFAVLSDRGSLHGQTDFGGIAPAADKHLKNQSDGAHPGITPAPGQSHVNRPGARDHGHNRVSGIPAPWVSDNGVDFQDDSDSNDTNDDSVAIPASNRPVLTLTALPTTGNTHTSDESPTAEATPTKTKTKTPKPTPTKSKKTKTPKASPTETEDDEDGDTNENPEIDDD